MRVTEIDLGHNYYRAHHLELLMCKPYDRRSTIELYVFGMFESANAEDSSIRINAQDVVADVRKEEVHKTLEALLLLC